MSDDSDGDTAVRVGIVGLGTIAGIHAGRLAELDAAVVGMDVDPDAREAFATEHDVPTVDDRDELFERVEAVLVATPNRYHEEVAVAALEAGLDVLVEKPLAHDVESAERVAAAAREADGFCMVGFHNRFAGPVRVLDRYRREGRLGEVTHVEAAYLRRRGVPWWGSWFTDPAVAGGGSLVDIGVHAVDLALSLLGFPEIEEVAGTTRSEFGGSVDYASIEGWGETPAHDDREFGVDDSATAFLRCAGGRTVSLEVAWAANRPSSQTYHVRGTEGGGRVDLESGDLTVYETVPGDPAHNRTTAVDTPEDDPIRAEEAAFLAGVRSGEPPEKNTVEQALTVQRVLDAIYRSGEAGRAVTLD